MASLKRDTPAGRAALARRRQRAAAVTEHSSRFVHPDDDDDDVAAEESSSSIPTRHGEQPQQQPMTSPPLDHTTSRQPDPPPQQQQPTTTQHTSSRWKDPKNALAGSYSAASLPSNDELLERSSQVAQEAALVLASARKSKRPTLLADNNNRGGEQEQGPPSTAAGSSSPLSSTQAAHQQQQPPLLQHGEQGQPRLLFASVTTPEPKETLDSLRGGGVFQGVPPSVSDDYFATGANLQQQHCFDDDDDDDDDDQNHNNNNEEDNVTMEELEPVLATAYEVLDAAAVASGSSILLRSMATSSTVTANSAMALVGGTGLGATEEVLHISKVLDSQQQQDDGGPALSNSTDGLPVRWGDTVALWSSSSFSTNNSDKAPKAMGVQRRSKQQQQQNSVPIDYQIGWFKSTLGQAETWTILRGRDNTRHGVRVGLAALRASKVLAERRAARGEYTRAVQSGDPILLRHDQTGGILSVNLADGVLQLVTDSYDSNRNNVSSSSSSLLSQLQRHDRYLPTDRDTFALVKSSVPPCPRWILGGGTSTSSNQTYNPLGHRMYLHQTYLTVPTRNNENQALQENLFGSQWSSLSMGGGVPEQSRQRMELADQESLLIDEVIGACLGLEGKHICATAMDAGDSDQVGHARIANSQTTEFSLREGSDLLFDASLRNLIERMLPLATSYVHVSAFVASHLPGYEFGSVMQAFCEALDGMLQEYAVFLAEMEQRFRQQRTGDALTLRRLHAQLIPSLHSMSVLERAAFAVRDKTGGALINSLSTLKAWSCEGDLVANQVLTILLDKASIPYMTMLTTWLQQGLLRDEYCEFMIEIKDQEIKDPSELKHSADSDFNNVLYTLREEHGLTELMSSDVLLQKVVATGKYWRAVRDCEVALRKKASPVENADERQQSTAVLQYSLSFNNISSFIQSMYEGASQALVNLLMEDFRLMDALRSMKQYFLLDHGDFLVHFLDAAEDELLKELGDVSTGRIQHWLRMSVQMTEAHSGEYRRRPGDRPGASAEATQSASQRSLSPLALRCRFQPISLINHVDSLHGGNTNDRNVTSAGPDESVLGTPSRDAYGISKGLTGVETFVLDFPSVPFPISLVLSDSALDSYQLLFRLLFFAKYVERRLVGIWQDHQAMKELNSIRGLFGPTFLLRQRMLHFAQNLIYYIMFEVIEPNWLEMEEAIGNHDNSTNKRTVDDIVDVHEAFLQRTLEACLLTNRELVRTLTKLMTTCLMFADQMKLFTEATKIHDESSHIAAERRKTIQRNLNERGGGGSKAPVDKKDKKVLREAMHSFKQDRQTRLKKQKRRVGRELSSESYRRMVTRFDEVFSAYLSEFMVQLNSDMGTHTHKTNLCIRLDYNGFLASSIVVDNSQIN